MLLSLPDLLGAVPAGQRLLGLDPGSRMIGVAVSDVTLMLASPHTAIKRAKLAINAAEIANIAKKLGAGGLVVGLPLSMDGSFGPAAQAARDWARALGEFTAIPCARHRRAEVVDRTAAAYMLQAALDAGRQARQEAAPLEPR